MSSRVWRSDLLLGSKFVKLLILPTQLLHFLFDELGELRSIPLGVKGFR